MSKQVFVGMSGGVDSSVTAALLQEQGYHVTGVFMKNWTQDLPGFPCPWREDFNDAKRVAVQLGIDFKVYDFQKEYKRHVVDYMIAEYTAGRTPNPDIMCNQEVKFKLFLDAALADGADMIATGHYANTTRSQDGQTAALHTAANTDKDQTYFLYRVTEPALQRTLFPLGEYATKREVRALAEQFKLATATKKDSQGICFVGKVGIREFLQQYVQTKPGAIIDNHGRTVGEHDGAIFYTIGQRRGLGVGGGLPYYVTGKDMSRNEVYVSQDLSSEQLWSKEVQLTDLHWINQPPEAGKAYQVRTRYRAPLVNARAELDGSDARLELNDQVRAVTSGQSAVIYDGTRIVGGGIVV